MAWAEGDEERREANRKRKREQEEIAQIVASGGSTTRKRDQPAGAALSPKAQAFAADMARRKAEQDG